ncbi:hypothetical protein D3C76_1486810 [compost metagenome]
MKKKLSVSWMLHSMQGLTFLTLLMSMVGEKIQGLPKKLLDDGSNSAGDDVKKLY